MSEESVETKMIKDAAIYLGEHFDTVQIFATRHEAGSDDGSTRSSVFGIGNFYARYGKVREWLLEQDARTAEPDDEK